MKKILFTFAFIALFLSSYSKSISNQQLVSYALAAFQQRTTTHIPLSVSDIKSITYIAEQNDTLLAVFNFQNRGFIILSADDVITPVLAYSTDESFIVDEAAPAALEILDSYKEAILYAKRNNLPADETITNAWLKLKTNDSKEVTSVVVSPLITARWNQNKYYNQYSPIDADSPGGYDGKVPNGCVALAMAMIIYYYRYPEVGQNSHTNYSQYGNFYVNFAQQNYHYEAMLDELNSYNNEVAKLIFHCATSVDMSYAPEGSGAYSEDVPNALKTYFNYSNAITYASRNNYNGTQWRALIRGELDNGRPAYYSGYSQEGGHAFVCDGYDTDDLFHFNFGWGGSSNGYFVVDRVSSAVNGYGSGQRIIYEIYPDDNYPSFCSNSMLITAYSGTLEDGSANVNYENNLNCTYIISPPNASSISVNINRLETELGVDTLSFWNGNPANGHLIASYSGTVYNENLSVQTDSLFITFNSNDAITQSGWRLNYSVDQSVESCEGYLMLTEHTGTFTDGSGDLSYSSNAECTWIIQPYGGTDFITLNFSELDISPDDRIYVYNTGTYPTEMLAEVSGNTIPNPITSYSSRMKVVFASDNWLQSDGFTAQWITASADIANNELSSSTLAPNPASTFTTLNLPNDISGELLLSIYDYSGKLMLQQRQIIDNDKSINIDVQSLSNGFYFLTVSNNHSVLSKKLIVNH